MEAVEVQQLERTFTARRKPPVQALDKVSFSVAQGEVHGLLGPNGAGKTSLLKILTTVLLPTSGSARVNGHDVVREAMAVRRQIGIVFGGERGLYTRLSARQNLEYWGALYRLNGREIKSRSEALLERVGLTERADARVETYSRGMKQRLHLARGLMGRAAVLFLDEPTIGMDPIAARDFRRLVGELAQEGHTVLLATHDMAEAETVCDRVTLIDRGRIIATESPRSLSQHLAQCQVIEIEGIDTEARAALGALPGVARLEEQDDGSVKVEFAEGGALQAVLPLLARSKVTSIRTSSLSLEEVYVRLIGDRGFEV